jgi:hypothetical protein
MEDNRGLVKVIDIETSALLADMLDYSSFPYKLKPDAKLHVVVIRDAYTDELFVAEGGEITKEWMKASLTGCKYLIHHNGVKFDLISLKLFGVLDYSIGYLNEADTLFGEEVKMVDTLILSRLFNPDRYNGHSLASWGERTGCAKMDFRGELIKRGLIPKDSPQGFEFRNYTPLMTEYCILDTEVGKRTFFALMEEKGDYKGWDRAIKMEHKLADLAIRRENFGFWFDKDLAVKCVEDLTQKMEELQNKVNPLLPPKPMGKTELSHFTPPNTQFLKSGKPSTHIIKFAERIGGKIMENQEEKYFIEFEGNSYELPYNLPLKTHIPADISNLDHVKMTLIDVHSWIPTEWAERDLTKDSKKQSISLDKRVKALERWYNDTMEGKYQKLRLEITCERFKVKNVEDLFETIKSKLESDFPVRVPTSPKVRVGVEKELCPNLVKLGEDVEFANDFALFLTYKHRKSSIAGGEIEDMDFDLEAPNTGFLSMYREIDGRIPTPAIEIGAASNRYRHIGVANIARASSIYGKEMRSLFGCGENYIQFGFDYSSLENRVQGGYVRKYEGGEELAKMLLAEKPNDLHSINAQKLNISRSDAKSFGYAILYGASVNKLSKMLNISMEKAKELFDGFWEAVPALKQLKEKVIEFWEGTGKSYIRGIDGRKIFIRSPHSTLNFLFQSGGVICAKYTTVFLMQELEKLGHIIDPFISQPSVCEMISYHDESQLSVKNGLIKFETFETKENAEEFKNNWRGEGQLSTIKEGTKWYIALPNDVSLSLEKATKKTEELLKLEFELSFEYDVHRNWYGCH